MPTRRFLIAAACAAAIIEAVSAAYYFPRYWPENSPASITIVGSGFQSPSAYAGLTVGGSACASVTALSDSEVVCISTQTSGSGMTVSYNAGNIPPRAMVELSNQLGIPTPPFGDAWKLVFLPASSDIVFNLNCRMKDGKVLINELSGFLECSSIDVNDWAQGSSAFKFLYASLPSALSLNDPELAFRASANAATAKLTIKLLKDSSSGGAAAAQKLKDIFANGQFHASFGRIFNSMVLNGQKTDLKLSGLDESLPGTHIFLIYLGCLAFVFLSWQGFLFYQKRTKDHRKKRPKLQKKAAPAKKIEGPDAAKSAV